MMFFFFFVRVVYTIVTIGRKPRIPKTVTFQGIAGEEPVFQCMLYYYLVYVFYMYRTQRHT